MPELSEDMYCSQQITVAPMFPYLLRQYAKAAIRSQPSDLLRWSTAYFRCLSLNVPPPIKPRLEYPISKEYDGITPGWLKTLLNQLSHIQNLDFRVLWDRWLGACLNHETLIKILVLGGFDNVQSIPFYKFIALCCGFINENLTSTMIMVCEILTDEPEGGSAMISAAIFKELYTFLARIGASKSQALLNIYFTEKALGLIEEKEVEVIVEKEKTPSTSEEESSTVSEVKIEVEKVKEVTDEVISCLDLDEIPDYMSEDKINDLDPYSKQSETVEIRKMSINEVKTPIQKAKTLSSKDTEKLTDEDEEIQMSINEEAVVIEPIEDKDDSKKVEETPDKLKEESEDEEEVTKPEVPPTNVDENTDDLVDGINKEEEQKDPVEAIISYLHSIEDDGEEQEPAASIVEEESLFTEFSSGKPEEEEEITESQFAVEEVYVEAIPGIGGVVPEDLIQAVVSYVGKCSNVQSGMVMPRNIRHYNCPPLEDING